MPPTTSYDRTFISFFDSGLVRDGEVFPDDHPDFKSRLDTCVRAFEACRDSELILDAVAILDNNAIVRYAVPEAEVAEVESVREPPRAHHFRTPDTQTIFPTQHTVEATQTYAG